MNQIQKSKTERRNRSMEPDRSQGFSLLELLMVIAIFAIVMAAVMGTLSIATRSVNSNQLLAETNQNVRGSSRFVANDLVAVGDDFMGINQNDSVFVKGGYLTGLGFPQLDVQTTINATVFDELFAIQMANNQWC